MIRATWDAIRQASKSPFVIWTAEARHKAIACRFRNELRNRRTAVKHEHRFMSIIDRRRLGTVLQNAETRPQLRTSIQALEDALEQAHGVDPTQMPHDVVTMNSTIVLRDLESNDTETYTLAYPERADIRMDRISVLAPSGIAVLGCAIGDVVEVETPSGIRHVRVEDIQFQPERAGEFDL
jgi:regulator of nucleoside diphosphate kinase